MRREIPTRTGVVGGPSGGRVGSLRGMETPPPDPEKLLATWMEWERGESTPGRVMADLKTGGMPELLRALVERQPSQR